MPQDRSIFLTLIDSSRMPNFLCIPPKTFNTDLDECESRPCSLQTNLQDKFRFTALLARGLRVIRDAQALVCCHLYFFLMNFQSLPLPPPTLRESGNLLKPVRQCGCDCTDACRCACSCRNHCTCAARCDGTCAAHLARNLVICLDSAVAKLGSQNTNVLELHSRILVDPDQDQLTYYACASGVYTSSHDGTMKQWFRRVENAVDRVIGRNSKQTVLKAYLWICEQSKPGDNIFLFGFSQGAHDARTLADMIDKVGLVNVGNEGLIPLAYDVFLDTQRGPESALREAGIFKTTFARSIKIHFVGVWDTLPPSGTLQTRWLPSSPEGVCIFRHALALDECKLGYLPATAPSPLTQLQSSPKEDGIPVTQTKTRTDVEKESEKRTRAIPNKLFPGLVETGHHISPLTTDIPNIKEVWFPGTHVDMGGGLKSDAVLSSVSLLWMENEAASAGLRLRSRTCGGKWLKEELRVAWDLQKPSSRPLRQDTEQPPSTHGRRLLDFSFIKPALSKFGGTWTPHTRKSRVIFRGQHIHASVAFMPKDYRPTAIFQSVGLCWENLVGRNIERTDFEWASRYINLLEVNLFDRSFMLEAIRNLTDAWSGGQHSDQESYWLGRLSFMALSGNLCVAYLSSSQPIWDDDQDIELTSAVKFFQKLADHRPAIFSGDLAEILEAHGRFSHLHGKGDPGKLFEDALCIRSASAGVLGRYKLASSLAWLASYALVIQKPQKALSLFEESVDVTRLLLADKYLPVFPLFALLQRNFTTCLNSLGENESHSALRVVETIVSLSRNLARSYPQYTPVLAAALHDRAFGFPPKFTPEAYVAEESIALYRNLAARNPNKYGAPYGHALHNLSARLFSLGQYESALLASFEESRMRRRLPDKDGLATCLDQLSRCFIARGKMNDALSAAEEAVRIRRKLAEENMSWEFESRLADSLNSLSCCLSLEPRQSSNALEAAREAVSVQRGLARDSPAEMFNSRLGIFLYNFSVGLSGAGRHEEALRAAEEMLKLHIGREDGDRALALSRVASCLRAAGKPVEALETAKNCLDVVRRLMAAGRTHKFGIQRAKTQLAESLFTISFAFPAAEALEVARDSVAIFRQLSKLSSPALNTALARALLQLSTLLLTLGKDDEALRIAVEAAQISCGLAKDCYSACLYHLSLCLHTVGKREQGLDSAQHCVELRRELAREYGTWQFKEKLADALFNLSLYFSSPAALQIVREAIELQRELVEHLPSEKFGKRLGDGLQNLAAHALLAGQVEDALSAAEESVSLTRKLAETSPVEHNPGLVNMLYTYANILSERGRHQDGYIAIVEADVMRLGLSFDSPIGSLEASAAYKSTRARCLIGMGQQNEGICALLDAISLYRKALDEEKAPYMSAFESFPWFLKNAFACIQSGLDKSGVKVAKAIGEVVALSRLLAGYYPERFNQYLQESLELHANNNMCPAG
ncbi:hypothetical protein C8R45DRAFT_1213793 [Mycena sanguinolenta]|nr:hypothetical protein C8R45DRAFT_1213793 [Mycena sanguinolenta]